MWCHDVRQRSDGDHSGNAGDRGIVDRNILQGGNVDRADAGEIGNGGVLLGTNRSRAAGIDPRTVGADEIALGCRREDTGYINGIYRRCVVAVIDQDILAAAQRRIAADSHLRVAVEIIFDIAGDIDDEVADYRHSSAVAGDKKTAEWCGS